MVSVGVGEKFGAEGGGVCLASGCQDGIISSSLGFVATLPNVAGRVGGTSVLDVVCVVCCVEEADLEAGRFAATANNGLVCCVSVWVVFCCVDDDWV